MSATLTWFNSGLGAKTGTASANLITDFVTLITSKSGDANFAWQVASSTTASSPNYIVLKRKSGAVGRILLVIWTSAPAGNNAAILDQAPGTNTLFGAYFPAGNVDTPSNLTASSGTVMGDDTGAVKVWTGMLVSTVYAASIQPFYFDSAEAVLFGLVNPAIVPSTYLGAAGNIVVDASDTEYPAVMSFASNAASNFGNNASSNLGWTGSVTNAGSVTPTVRTNYGSANRAYFTAWAPSGAWANQAVGATDILTDTAGSKAYFVPCQLLGQVKNEGFVLKLRQFAYGPASVGPFTVYNTTGPVVAARQFHGGTTGTSGAPWATNFKV